MLTASWAESCRVAIAASRRFRTAWHQHRQTVAAKRVVAIAAKKEPDARRKAGLNASFQTEVMWLFEFQRGAPYAKSAFDARWTGMCSLIRRSGHSLQEVLVIHSPKHSNKGPAGSTCYIRLGDTGAVQTLPRVRRPVLTTRTFSSSATQPLPSKTARAMR